MLIGDFKTIQKNLCLSLPLGSRTVSKRMYVKVTRSIEKSNLCEIKFCVKKEISYLQTYNDFINKKTEFLKQGN